MDPPPGERISLEGYVTFLGRSDDDLTEPVLPHQPENPLSSSVIQLGKRVVEKEDRSAIPRPADRISLDQPQRECHGPALPSRAELPHIYLTIAVR